MTYRAFLSVAVLAAAVAAAVGLWVAQGQTSGGIAAAENNIYQKVRTTGVIRCGYFEEPPFTMTDPKTGQRSGIAVDVIEAIAAHNGLKVDWAEQIVFGTFLTDLANQRYDAVCGSVFTIPRGQGEVDYTAPYAIAKMNAYVKAEATGWGDAATNKARLKLPTTTFAVVDGEAGTLMKRNFFPAAKEYALPQNGSVSELLLSVATGKADVTLVLESVFAEYNKHNPGVLVPLSSPSYQFPIGFATKVGEHDFRQFLDVNLRTLAISGELQEIFERYPNQVAGVYRPNY